MQWFWAELFGAWFSFRVAFYGMVEMGPTLKSCLERTVAWQSPQDIAPLKL